MPAAEQEISAPETAEETEPQPGTARKTIVGVRFRTAGKIYYFSPDENIVKKGDHVIVETARGVEFGTVISNPMELGTDKIPKQLKSILRVATQEDIDREKENRIKEKEAYRICLEKIAKHNPEMKLINAEYTFDNSKILFYFTADGRVDFRDLVKDLANVFRTRIELRQIGVRDEAKILGGYGICGRPLCCHSYLSDFVPVSIKMAKEQNLSLNPAKISGVCGRLMCCLKNEEDIYEELNKKLPKPGDEVEGNDGLRGEVASVNILRQTVRILVEVDDEKELHEYGEGEWTLIRKRKKGRSGKKKSENTANGSGGPSGKDQQGKDRPEGKGKKSDGEGKKPDGEGRRSRGQKNAGRNVP
ncbi:MAG: stage 0 sporulation family protein [Lachnospiraceae bacterium]|nr:stage 0 sporulation family protein [Lachnospiraceae bacterium]